MTALVQQLVSQGMSPEDAQQKAMDMMQQMMQASAPSGTQSMPGMNRTTLTGFANGSGMGNGSGSEGYQAQQGLNRRFTNWNPVRLPPGRI